MSRILEQADGPLVTLIVKAIRFANWAVGEGICTMDGTVDAPEEFLLEYSCATGDEDWETLADRIGAIIKAKEAHSG